MANPASAPKHAPHPPSQTVRFELAPRTLWLILLIAAALWVLSQLGSVCLVLVGALMLVGALSPLVRWLEERKCRRTWSIGLVFGGAFLLLGLGLFFTVPALVGQLRDLVEHEAELRDRIVAFLGSSPLTRSLSEWVRDIRYDEMLKGSKTTLLAASFHVFEIFAYGMAAIFLALYIIIDRDRLRGGLFALVPRKHHVRTSRVLLNLEVIVGGYIRGQMITCLAMALFILAVLLIFRVPNALALAVFGGVADVLPYIGAFVTIGPAVAAAYTVGPGTAAAVLGLLLVYEEFESRVLVPLVYGRALRLPSSVVFFSLLVGGTLGGIVGALLALPIASAVLMVLEELRVELPGETTQPADVALRRKDEREEREYEARTEAVPAVEASAVAVEIARERKEEEDGVAHAAEAKK